MCSEELLVWAALTSTWLCVRECACDEIRGGKTYSNRISLCIINIIIIIII